MPSLVVMFLRWLRTVFRLMFSLSAISLLVLPLTINWRTSVSRVDSSLLLSLEILLFSPVTVSYTHLTLPTKLEV